MSEPMSSGEIEDVLSSIRKLVSEDLRPVTPRPKPSLSVPEPAERSAAALLLESDKLLLTPALRVVEVRPGPEEPATHEAGGPADLARVDAPTGQVAAAAGEDPEPLSLDRTLRLDPEEAQRNEFDPVGEHPASGTEEDEDPAPFAEDFAFAASGGESGIGAALTSIGSAVDQNRDEWESETGDGGFASLAWKAPQWVEEAEILTPATAPLSGHDVESGQGVEQLSPEAAEAAALAEIEAAERAAWGDTARYDSEPGPSPVPPQARTSPDEGSEPEADLLAEDDPVYDEELLRDLVRDIIREELSGTLGERITRNVRKLVRAEIARAMTVREFD